MHPCICLRFGYEREGVQPHGRQLPDGLGEKLPLSASLCSILYLSLPHSWYLSLLAIRKALFHFPFLSPPPRAALVPGVTTY